jgi:flagellar biosynthesis protein FlhB
MIGLVDLLLFFVALGNPIMLLGVFILACVVIYTISGFIFLRQGLDKGKQCKPGLKDWIRVNAFVTLVFVFQGLIETIMKLFNPSLFKQTVADAWTMQQSMLPSGVSQQSMMDMMKVAIWISITFSLILLIHVIITFRLLKIYKHVFDTPPAH